MVLAVEVAMVVVGAIWLWWWWRRRKMEILGSANTSVCKSQDFANPSICKC